MFGQIDIYSKYFIITRRYFSAFSTYVSFHIVLYIQESQWEIAESHSSEVEEEEVHIRSLGSGFWFRFLELQRKTLWVMGRIGIDGAGQESHQPWKWPLNLNTQKFCPNSPRAALVGSPFV